jgi:RNA polymerase sigma-70 factor (ECF subfamily)
VERHPLAFFLTERQRPGHYLHVHAAALTVTSDDFSEACARLASERFTVIYNQHFAFVWRNLRRLGVASAGLDDAAQDVFLVAHRRLPDVPDDALRPWLFGVVRKVAASHRRGASRRDAASLDVAPEPIAAGPGPERRLGQAEAARLVHALLARLSDDQREVFVLAELEQMAAPEIASAIGVRLNTVYSRLRAARAAFEKQAARLVAREGRGRVA